jgi:predicted DNA-binding transcriptional regulator YafY
MRADRLLAIVLLIQRDGQLTAAELAAATGVTERTIYRDVQALSLAGVPLYTQPGPRGGIALDAAYRSHLNWFTGPELQALLYTGSAAPLAELGLGQAMDHAVLKLLTLLPERGQREAELMRQRLYLDPSGWYGFGEAHPTLPSLKEAVWKDRRIQATYDNWEGLQRPVELAPYSLVYKTGRWYLVAAEAGRGPRTYRVSRLSEIDMLTEGFERDTEFDIASYWAEADAAFQARLPRYPATLRVRREALVYFEQMYAGRYEVVEDGEEWLRLRVEFMVIEEARTSALGLGTDAEVLEPIQLRAAVENQVRDMAAKLAANGEA